MFQNNHFNYENVTTIKNKNVIFSFIQVILKTSLTQLYLYQIHARCSCFGVKNSLQQRIYSQCTMSQQNLYGGVATFWELKIDSPSKRGFPFTKGIFR